MAFELYDHSTDIQKRHNGVWIDKTNGLEGADDLRLHVLGAQAKAIKKLAIELESSRPAGIEKDQEKFASRQQYELNEKLKAGLLGWENFQEKGEAVAFSKEYAAAKIDDERFEKFKLIVIQAMNLADNIKIEWTKDAEKNSDVGIAES